MMRKPQKPPDGARLKETADMLAWRKDFEKMKTDEHLQKLSELGLDDEDLEEFKELKSGKKSLEGDIFGEGAPAKGELQEETKEKKKKK